MSTPMQNRQFSPFQPGIAPDTRASNPQQFASNAQGFKDFSVIVFLL